MDGVSVVLCCYNSEKRLPEAISHLARQKLTDAIPWEIILVDNGSNDHTSSVALKLWEQGEKHIPFRIVLEPTPGLSAARKAGVLAALFEFVLFCDDDNYLQEHYIERAYDLIKGNPNIGILGGIGIPIFGGKIPEWFSTFRSSYAVGPQASQTGFVMTGKIVYGAGMVIRKSPLLLLYAHGFNGFLSGRKGSELLSGEDNELCIWYRILGYELFYSEDLTFHHFIPMERLKMDYLLKRSFAKGKTEAILLLYRDIDLTDGTVTWIDHRLLWYYEIAKRISFYLRYKLNPFKHLLSRLAERTLASSISFRLSNYSLIKQTKKDVFALVEKFRKSN